MIKDSGARREFTSGAVRDIAEGKGRCDLLPLDILGHFLESEVLLNIDEYIWTGDAKALWSAIKSFCQEYSGKIPDVYTASLEASIQYEEGAKKYSPRNWQKGIDLHCFIDSGVRHYLKFKRGDNDEPHDRAFIWNMLGALWTQKNKQELIDLPFAETVQGGN